MSAAITRGPGRRLWAAIGTDLRLQARNQLLAISVGVSVIVGGALAWLASADNLHGTVPLALLMFVGGSTLLYVVAMIILERDDGTLAAVCVSPLRPWEYLSSKVLTLTGLATIEGVLITAGALALLGRAGPVPIPNALLLLGLISLGVMHVLVGVILVVRYDGLMAALVPMAAIATVMQVPAFYFVDGLDYAPLLLIPTAAPTMLIRGAFVPLLAWEWAYALGVTAITLAVLVRWSLRAFEVHVIGKAG